MTDLPPGAPAPTPLPGPAPVDPKSAVSGPATGLMVTGGIGIALQLLSLLLNILGTGLNLAAGGRGAMPGVLQGGVGIVFNIIGLAVGAAILYGAMKMKNLQNYSLAMSASIIAMIPCISPCCLLGLPIGIWALVILMKPEVKAAFDGGPRGFPVQ